LSHQPDYSILDRPEILQFVFYPRRDWTPTPPGASDYLVPVEQGVSISCRFYPASTGSPCIIYFHGNGEVACEHDWIAPFYNREGIGLFVADYRGYGLSDGTPTFSSMTADAHPILDFVLKTVRSSGHSEPLFLMGRSLGSHCAVELAFHYPEHFTGLIVESGAPNVARLASLFGLSSKGLTELRETISARIRSIGLPTLIIHGERDSLIPPSEATTLYKEIASHDKRLVIIPGADHNDIMLVGMEQYFSAVKGFVFRGGG
jgi:alpha-beta hydrolase superfamily lysophospholipase